VGRRQSGKSSHSVHGCSSRPGSSRPKGTAGGSSVLHVIIKAGRADGTCDLVGADQQRRRVRRTRCGGPASSEPPYRQEARLPCRCRAHRQRPLGEQSHRAERRPAFQLRSGRCKAGRPGRGPGAHAPGPKAKRPEHRDRQPAPRRSITEEQALRLQDGVAIPPPSTGAKPSRPTARTPASVCHSRSARRGVLVAGQLPVGRVDGDGMAWGAGRGSPLAPGLLAAQAPASAGAAAGRRLDIVKA
jgi:hypothetical protein